MANDLPGAPIGVLGTRHAELPTAIPGPLFSPAQIGWASLVGTPVAGAILAAWNLRRLQRPAMGALAAGVCAISLAVVLDSFWWPALPVLIPLCAVVASVLTRRVFGPSLRIAGRRSGWTATGTVLLVIVALEAAAAGIERMGVAVPGPSELLFDFVPVAGGGGVRYGAGATRADAERVRDARSAAGYQQVTLSVARHDQELVLSLRLPGVVDEGMVERGRRMAQAMANSLESCVRVRLVNAGDRELASGHACPAARGL